MDKIIHKHLIRELTKDFTQLTLPLTPHLSVFIPMDFSNGGKLMAQELTEDFTQLTLPLTPICVMYCQKRIRIIKIGFTIVIILLIFFSAFGCVKITSWCFSKQKLPPKHQLQLKYKGKLEKKEHLRYFQLTLRYFELHPEHYFLPE